MRKVIGGIIYEGPSKFDGSPIVVILTGIKHRSRNAKTGDMVQAWIMRADIDPAEAIRQKKDEAICGSCPQRRNQGGACYVVVEKAPLTIWRAWKNGRYEDWRDRLPPKALEGRTVRFGAYGDPASVPAKVWRRIRRQNLAGWTGYTHQWKDADHLRPFVMASVDSPEEQEEAAKKNWRSFRVRGEDEPLLPGEIDCPSTRGVQCESCGLCRGSARIAASVSIIAHGFLASRFNKGRKLRTVS